jgi:hypothetical protein
MNGMMNASGMGWMMAGMVIGWLSIVALLILAVFTLLKNLCSK